MGYAAADLGEMHTAPTPVCRGRWTQFRALPGDTVPPPSPRFAERYTTKATIRPNPSVRAGAWARVQVLVMERVSSPRIRDACLQRPTAQARGWLEEYTTGIARRGSAIQVPLGDKIERRDGPHFDAVTRSL
jgi:hypothetical protein